MPRRNTIPLPSLPGVSRAGPTSKLNPGDAARPGLAAGQFGAALGQAASNLALQLKETRDQVAREEFSSAVKIYKMKQKDIEDVSWDQFQGAAKQADPTQIMGIYLDHVERANAAHEQGLETLRSGLGALDRKDRKQAELLLNQLEAEYQGNKARDFQDAKLIATERTVELETNLAKRQYQRNYEPGIEEEMKKDPSKSNISTEQAAALLEAENVLKKHIPNEDEFNEVIRTLQIDAEYDFFVEMSSKAVTNEDIEALSERFEDREKMFEHGHRSAIRSAIQGAINRRDRNIHALERAAYTGKLTDEDLNLATASGLIDPEKRQDLLELRSARLNQEEQERLLAVFKSAQWTGTDGMRARLADLVKRNRRSISLTKDAYQEMVKIIDTETNVPSARAFAKSQALGMLLNATGELEGIEFFNTEHVGELIGAIENEDRRNIAASHYRSTIGKMQAVLTSQQIDMPIYEQATELEEVLADLYQNDMPSDDEVNKRLSAVFGGFARAVLGEFANRKEETANVQAGDPMPWDQAVKALENNPSEENKQYFKDTYGTLPEGF